MPMINENPKAPMTAEMKVDVIRRHFAGEDMMDLCREFKINAVTFHGWRKTFAKAAVAFKEVPKAPVPPKEEPKAVRRSRKNPYTQDERDFALEMVATGSSPALAGKEIGATEQTVRNWMRKVKKAAADPQPAPVPEVEKPKPQIIVKDEPPNDVLIPTSPASTELRDLREENKILREVTVNQLVELTRLKKHR